MSYRVGRVPDYQLMRPNLEVRIYEIEKRLQLLLTSLKKVEVSEKEMLGISSLATRMDKLESDFKDLRSLLFKNPEEAVTIPLLKKDIDSLTQADENIRREIGRISGHTKWVIGIMTTMSIGLFSLAIGIFLKRG